MPAGRGQPRQCADGAGTEGTHLARVQAAGGRGREQEHVDELDENAGGHPGGLRRVDQPLVDDHEDEVPEHAEQEEQLGDRHQVDVELLPEMPGGGRSARTGLR